MWHPFRDRSEKRAADFGQALSQAYEALAGGVTIDSAQTAGAEFAIGSWARAFSVAEVSGADIPAATLEQIGRSLALRGNYVADIAADPMTGLTLLPAASWDIMGGPAESTWVYDVVLAGPSGQQTVTRRSADVVHVKVNSLPESSWAGRSPLIAAGFSARLVANMELRASEEAKARAGMLLPTPVLSDPSRTALMADLGAMRGSVAIVESGNGNFPRQSQGGPSQDWRGIRFGMNYPEGNAQLRREAAADVVASFGIPASLYSGSEGSSIREGWRQWGVSVHAWGRMVSDELSTKLDRPVSLSFRKLASIDLAARARAMGIMVSAGVSISDALKQVELDED